MKKTLDEILASYGELLASVDRWFARSMEVSGEDIVCAKGCSACCRGLFDITLLDACFLKQGFDRLPALLKEQVTPKALQRLEALRAARPDLEYPYILNIWPEEEWEMLMPDEDETPCPLLGDDGSCLVYWNRPMTCRLHGIPLVDVSGELFHDEWCTLNFSKGDPLARKGLQWGFREAFEEELLLFRDFTNTLVNKKINELDTFIPTALLIDFEGFEWGTWWAEHSERIRAAGSSESR
jgi:Fe-S-cluster containining protein